MIEIGARIIKGPSAHRCRSEHDAARLRALPPRLRGQCRQSRTCTTCRCRLRAERGLPALLIWIWFVASLAVAQFRLFRTQSDKVPAAAGLAAVAAMLAAGLFEYNFGDSEFLMLFLVLVTLPFAAARGEPGPRGARLRRGVVMMLLPPLAPERAKRLAAGFSGAHILVDR